MTTDLAAMQKVLLPMIRRVIPSLIANEIVGVQPMSGPTQRWSIVDDPYNAYPYSVTFNQSLWALSIESKTLVKMLQWCNDTIPSGNWYSTHSAFHFRNAEDRTMFMLKAET
jgi:hypothetical protein